MIIEQAIRRLAVDCPRMKRIPCADTSVIDEDTETVVVKDSTGYVLSAYYLDAGRNGGFGLNRLEYEALKNDVAKKKVAKELDEALKARGSVRECDSLDEYIDWLVAYYLAVFQCGVEEVCGTKPSGLPIRRVDLVSVLMLFRASVANGDRYLSIREIIENRSGVWLHSKSEPNDEFDWDACYAKAVEAIEAHQWLPWNIYISFADELSANVVT